eukprot:CAMPEP_0201878076 /NCGR_PEP_ID=MMETSP0902-20130614/9334_1 /ASSEMBLY_ACC=CAM_ASM_000551 /TAXON_ID=420261 /ORGANISM="Thalassiosira antarctica, Strain CCMP982" /LENGTH=40 /DNA_ID= /DNA_START= /DNA_END= /DNA_ORIENTATION=
MAKNFNGALLRHNIMMHFVLHLLIKGKQVTLTESGGKIQK